MTERPQDSRETAAPSTAHAGTPPLPVTPHPLPAPAATPVDWRRLRLWQIQPVRDLLVLATIIGLVYLGYVLRVVMVPVLLALLLAYLFEPVVAFLDRRRLVSRPGAAIGIITAVVLLLVIPTVLGTGFAVIQGARAARTIADGVTRVQASVAAPDDQDLKERVPPGAWTWIRDRVVQADQERRKYLANSRGTDADAPGTTDPASPDAGAPDAPPAPRPDETAGRTETPLPDSAMGPPSPLERMALDSDDSEANVLIKLSLDWLREHGSELAASLGRRFVGGGAQAVGAAVSTFTSVGYLLFAGFLTAFFFYFFSTGWARVVEFAAGLIPVSRREEILGMVRRMDRVIAGFVRGRLSICLILVGYMTLSYWLAGVPAPLVLGPLVGALFIVPFIHVLGVPIAMLLMWLDPLGPGNSAAGTAALWAFQREWWWIVGAPIGIYAGAQFLDDWVLTPTIQGKTTDLSVPLILFASIAGGALAGIYGLLIAIPVAACLKIVAEEIVWPRVNAWVKGREKDFLPIGRE